MHHVSSDALHCTVYSGICFISCKIKLVHQPNVMKLLSNVKFSGKNCQFYMTKNVKNIMDDLVKFSTILSKLNNENLQDCIALLNICIEKYHFPAIYLARIIDLRCEFNQKNVKAYLQLFEYVYQNSCIHLCGEMMSGSPLSYILVKKYNINVVEFITDKTIEELFDVYPKDSLMYYMLNDKEEEFMRNYNYNSNSERVYKKHNLLDHSAILGKENIFKFLLQNNFKITQETLQLAFFGNNQVIIAICMQQDLELDDKCMFNAILSNNNNFAKWIHETYGIAYDWKAIENTCNVELFKEIYNDETLILNYRNCMNITYLPFLCYATGNHTTIYAQFFDTINESHTDNGLTPLDYAIIEGMTEIVKMLIDEYHVDIEMQHELLYTRLMICAQHDNVEIAKLLIERGGGIEDININGQNVLHVACIEGSNNFVKFILPYFKDNLDIADAFGNSPLAYCVKENHYESAKILIEKGANIEQICENEQSILAKAIIKNAFEIFNLLLDKGAKFDYEDQRMTPLMYCAELNRLKMAEILINKGAKVNRVTTDGNTALHYAAYKNNYDVGLLLVKNGANVNIKDSNGFSPLYNCISNNNYNFAKICINKETDINIIGNQENIYILHCCANKATRIFRLLIEYGLNIKHINSFHNTALHISAASDAADIARILVENGVDIDAQNIEGNTALHIAIYNKAYLTSELLISKNANVNIFGKGEINSLILCAYQKDLKTAELLLKHGAQIFLCKKYPKCAFHYAVQENLLDFVKLFMQFKDQKNEYKVTPLHFCAMLDKVNIAKELKDECTELEKTDTIGNTPLMYAVEGNSTMMVDYLIKCKVDVNHEVDGYSPLLRACEFNYTYVVKQLLEAGADINYKDKDGQDCLMKCALFNCFTAARVLIDHGISLTNKDKYGNTALSLCTRYNSNQTIKIILDKLEKADKIINEKNNEGFSPLHHCATFNFPTIAKLLIDHGADIKIMNKNGVTPLHIAAQYDYLEIAEILLNADNKIVNIEDKERRTPLMHCAQFNSLRVADLLVKTQLKLYKSLRIDQKDKQGNTALMFAARHNNLQFAKFLLNCSCDFDTENYFGIDALTIAHYFNSKNVAQLLMKNNATKSDFSERDKIKMDFMNNNNLTIKRKIESENKAISIDQVIMNDDPSVILYALEKSKLNVNQFVEKVFTLLMLCMIHGSTNIARLLIAKGADVNLANKDGVTPLMVACQTMEYDSAILLLCCGADVNRQDKHGNTALSICNQLNYIPLAKRLNDFSRYANNNLEN